MEKANTKDLPSKIEEPKAAKKLCGCLVIDECGCIEDPCATEVSSGCNCYRDPCACPIPETGKKT